MKHAEQVFTAPAFNEDEWIRLVFLLSDTQNWMNELAQNAILQVPITDRKKMLRRNYCISVTALAHIIERHYYKIQRHPGASKFTLPLLEILPCLRDAGSVEAKPMPGTLNYSSVYDAGKVIGFDLDRVPTHLVTVITDSGGRVVTAFPGLNKCIKNN